MAVRLYGGAGFDVINAGGRMSDYNIATEGQELILTRYSDGAMIALKNIETVTFQDNQALYISPDLASSWVARIWMTFRGQGMHPSRVWNIVHELELSNRSEDYQFVLDYLEATSIWPGDSAAIPDTINSLYSNALGRLPTLEEHSAALAKISQGTLSYLQLSEQLAFTGEAASYLNNVLLFPDWI